MNLAHERDGRRCVVFGILAETTHHRIHGDRSNMRPSNLLSVSGSGTTGGHGWIEHNPLAAREAYGWTVSKHDPRDLTEIPAWMEAGPFGQGWYLLDDEWGFRGWPGSVLMQGLSLPDPPAVLERRDR